MRKTILTLTVVLLVAGKGGAGGVDGVSYGPAGGYGVNTFAVDPLHPEVLYAATRTEGLFKSLDGGISWEEGWVSPHKPAFGNTVLVDPVIDRIVIDPHHPGVVYIQAAREGLLKSNDGGKTWEKVPAVLPGKAGIPSFLNLDPLQAGVIYAGNTGSERGLFRSADSGLTWNLVLPQPIAAVVIPPQNPHALYALHDSRTALFKSDDGGITWMLASAQLPFFWRFQAIAVDPRHPEVVYVGGAVLHEHGTAIGGAIFKSEDSGGTWTQIFSVLDTWIQTLAVDPQNPNTVYAGSAGKVHTPGLFRSTNGGKSWTRAHATPVGAIIIDPQDSNTIYVGVPSGGGGIIRYTFNGQPTAVEQHSWGEVKNRGRE